MKTKISTMIAFVQAAIALAVMGAVRIWAPVCQKMLTLQSGKEVHMKCFYTDRASMGFAAILLVCALILALAKKDFRIIQVISFVTALILFLTATKVIGVCMNPEMPCNQTQTWLKILAGASMALSAVDLFAGKGNQLPQ